MAKRKRNNDDRSNYDHSQYSPNEYSPGEYAYSGDEDQDFYSPSDYAYQNRYEQNQYDPNDYAVQTEYSQNHYDPNEYAVSFDLENDLDDVSDDNTIIKEPRSGKARIIKNSSNRTGYEQREMSSTPSNTSDSGKKRKMGGSPLPERRALFLRGLIGFSRFRLNTEGWR
jgi:hypothetical protein